MATPPDRLDSPAATASPERNPATLALLIGGVLLVLLALWFFFLRGDGDPVETSAPPPVTEEEPAEETESPPPPGKGPVETFEVFAPKDPFDPLISASAGGSTTGETGTDAGDPAATDDTATTTDGTGTTTTTTGAGTSGGGAGGDAVGGHRVRIIDVFGQGGGRRVQVQVDGTVYTVDEGERFAQNFQLLNTSGDCATMLFGDDEFTLCEGEEVLK